MTILSRVLYFAFLCPVWRVHPYKQGITFIYFSFQPLIQTFPTNTQSQRRFKSKLLLFLSEHPVLTACQQFIQFYGCGFRFRRLSQCVQNRCAQVCPPKSDMETIYIFNGPAVIAMLCSKQMIVIMLSPKRTLRTEPCELGRAEPIV